MYREKMNDVFKKIPVTIPEPQPKEYKNTIIFLLKDIGEKWYINNLRDKTPPLNRPISSKEKKRIISRLG